MDTSYISTEVDRIIKDESLPFPQNFALASAWIMAHFKGINLKILQVSKVTAIAEYFILATASNIILASSMAQEISKQFKRHNINILSREGLQQNGHETDWILIDTGDLIIHIFLDHSRDLYGLDELWDRAPQVMIPEEFYFPVPQSAQSNQQPEGEYF